MYSQSDEENEMTIYVNYFTRKSYNMEKSVFMKLCEHNNYTAHEVRMAAEKDGWVFSSVLGLQLQDFIDMAFPAIAMKRYEFYGQ